MTGQYPTEFDEILWLRSELRNALAKVDRLRAELLTSYGQNQDLLDESKPVVWTDRKPDRPGEWWYRHIEFKEYKRVVRISAYAEELCVESPHYGEPSRIRDYDDSAQWSSEPCQPPEEPTT